MTESHDVRVVPAAEIAPEVRAAVWTDAFSDYFTPFPVTPEVLATMEQAFDLDRAASRLVVEDGRPVAFAMLGLRERRGWVGGMGVIPAARRRGHGERVMRGLIDAARERGLATVALEVLVQNTPAIPLYESLGFRTTRKLEVWERGADVPPPAEAGPTREIPVEEAAARIGERHLASAPWQRELAPARRVFPDLKAIASEDGSAIAVYRVVADRAGIVEIATADAPPGARERALDAVLSTIFREAAARPARLLNLPEGDPAASALDRAGAVVSHRQWEMVLPLE